MMDLKKIKKAHYVTAACLFILFFYIAVSAPPAQFPANQIITVKKGSGLLEVSESLKDNNVIRNAAWFRLFALVLGKDKSIQAGDYYLPYPLSVYSVVWRIVHGEHDIETVKITVPEGFTTKKISALFDSRFPFFDHSYFVSRSKEGYLFPDTYFIGVNASATSTIDLMNSNFDRKIAPLSDEIAASGHSLSDVLIMASIIESEAQTDVDRRIISGILWKRLQLGEPLQVDAPFAYLLGKTTKDLTLSDLNMDSPYNTYLHKGLTPTPICNPGIESIKAALEPESSPYLFFLTDKQGNMHYARTYAEHLANRERYLGY